MNTQLDERSRAPRQVGRRAVARGAAWSIPVVTLAVAAPAMAASGCKLTTGLLSWDLFGSGTNQTGKALATSGGTGVTVTVSLSGDTGAANNGEVTSTTTGGLSKVMRFYDLNNNSNTSQTVTLTFSQPVQNLSFSLLDVDSASSGRGQAAYEDLVIVNTAGWTATKHSNVKGNGTTALPYRAQNTNSPEAGSSADSNVDLGWTGPISSVSFTYKQDGSVNGDPFIGISDIAFQRCV
jgi:hypothetical protein